MLCAIVKALTTMIMRRRKAAEQDIPTRNSTGDPAIRMCAADAAKADHREGPCGARVEHDLRRPSIEYRLQHHGVALVDFDERLSTGS